MQKNGRCAGFLNTPNNVILTIRMYIYNIYYTIYISVFCLLVVNIFMVAKEL